MAMKVNAQRGNLKLEDGYVYLAECRLDKQLVPPPMTSPGAAVELTKENVRQQWRAVFHLFPTEQDRLRQHVVMGAPLSRREVTFGVQDGRDPLADAYSLLKDGGAWSDGWEVVVIGDA